MEYKGISGQVAALAEKVQPRLVQRFREIDQTSEINTHRIISAFRENRLSDSCFAGTTGYGYDDKGREVLDQVYAQVFGCQAALVRMGFVSGTHAISTALFAVLSPGKILLSVTGRPYDTLLPTIGAVGQQRGSLKYYGIDYREIALLPEGLPDLESIKREAARPEVGAVFVQRSRGYSQRETLSVEDIGEIVQAVRFVREDCPVVVDNCYGEFTQGREPTHLGADLVAGSLIKNPGGGIAPGGGYIAGRADLVDDAAQRLTAPGLGAECGPTMGANRLLFQGLFFAPHVVAQALKTAVFSAAMLSELGYQTSPGPFEARSDIIQAIELGTPERLEKFCRGIQKSSPVDSFVSPIPWQMPGYDCQVIMAAGTFVQGASIELSADGPVREPYTAFLQGGLTYESGKLAIMTAISEMLD